MNVRPITLLLKLARAVAPWTIVVLAVGAAEIALGCPNCREALADDPQGQNLAAGFYYSILFMVSTPFLILGTFATLAYRSVKGARRNDGVGE